MPADLNSILKLEVPLIVLIGERTLPVREVMSLGPGAIIELPKHADDELEILAHDKPIGKGTAVKVGENFGIHVTEMGNLRQRIAALGGANKSATTPQAKTSQETPVEEEAVA